MQANGAEMLRLACCLGTEWGIEICWPVHDAVLICAPIERLEEDVRRMRKCMADASRMHLHRRHGARAEQPHGVGAKWSIAVLESLSAKCSSFISAWRSSTSPRRSLP